MSNIKEEFISIFFFYIDLCFSLYIVKFFGELWCIDNTSEITAKYEKRGKFVILHKPKVQLVIHR